MKTIIRCAALLCLSANVASIQAVEEATVGEIQNDSPGAKDDWRVQLFNGDDFQFVICNGLPLLPRADYRQSVDVSLKDCIGLGRRIDIEIGLYNRTEGYAWGYRILKNGVVVKTKDGKPAESSCGKAGTTGCDNNAQAPAGIVNRWRYSFEN